MKIVRKNNKYCTIKEENLNATVIGNPTISDDYIVSNFSASNKLGLPMTLDPTQPYEIQIKFKLNSSTDADNRGLIGVTTSGIFCFWINRTGKIVFNTSNSTTDWTISQLESTDALSANTYYWGRAIFTGTKYELYLSTDGINWALEDSVNSSIPANNGNPLTLYLGNMHPGNWYLKGSMDLKECYIKSNNTFLWQGVEIKYYGIGDTLS